ncbi:MAG: hypothetical protein AAB734_01630, partial [Patescibacteria group bacterium]
MGEFADLIKHNYSAQIVLAFFAALVAWWATLYVSGASADALQAWAAAYQIVAFFGACVGFTIANHWGG